MGLLDATMAELTKVRASRAKWKARAKRFQKSAVVRHAEIGRLSQKLDEAAHKLIVSADNLERMKQQRDAESYYKRQAQEALAEATAVQPDYPLFDEVAEVTPEQWEAAEAVKPRLGGCSTPPRVAGWAATDAVPSSWKVGDHITVVREGRAHSYEISDQPDPPIFTFGGRIPAWFSLRRIDTEGERQRDGLS